MPLTDRSRRASESSHIGECESAFSSEEVQYMDDKVPDSCFIFFWSDVQILAQKPADERDMFIEEIWSTYFTNGLTPLPISLAVLNEIHSKMDAGRPYPADIFTRAVSTVYDHLKWEFSLPQFVRSCVQSAIYRKRAGSVGSIPSDAFYHLVQKSEEGSWKFVRDFSGVKMWRRSGWGNKDCSFTVAWKESVEVDVDAQTACNFIFSRLDRIPEWNRSIKSIESIEQLGPQCHVSHVIMNPWLPFAKPRDMVLLRAQHVLNNQVCVIINTSVEHGSILEKKKYKRTTLDLGGYIIIPKDTNRCEIVSLLHFKVGRLTSRILKANSALKVGAQTLNSLKKMLEGRDGTPLP